MASGTLISTNASWSFIKALVDGGTKLHYTEDGQKYELRTVNGPLVYETELYKPNHSVQNVQEPQNTNDLNEFENNYKAAANAIEKTLVEASFESDTELSVNVQSATVSKKLRYAQMAQNQSLTQDVYTTIYEYTGTGNFFGCHFNVADSDTEVKITVDGEVLISDFNISNIPIAGPGSSGNGTSGSIFIWRAEGDEVNFQPPSAIVYETSVKVELKAHHVSAPQRKMTFGYTVLTKET